MAAEKLLVYILRRDLRLADNPIFHYLSTANHGFRYLLPIYVFPPHQIELSGFLNEGKTSPYPPARSQLGNYWRCGPHRAKFIAQSVWDLKTSLEACSSGLEIRVGDFSDVASDIINHFKSTGTPVSDIWMTEELSYEEIQEQNNVLKVCEVSNVNFRLWQDEKYFVDDRDTELPSANDLPDVFTTYRKSQEPLRDRPRQVLTVDPSKLPRLPSRSTIPPQRSPFASPKSLDDLEKRLLEPLKEGFADFPSFPANASSAHPFQGGEQQGRNRLEYLVKSGIMGSYADTRNGLLGPDFSTKLSAYLALGCITARQVHSELVKLEDGSDDLYQGAKGFAEGESQGSKAVRLELLWRDYMRLCTRKFGTKLFKLSGFRHDESYSKKWKTPDKRKAAGNQRPSPDEISKIMDRIFRGTTGMGLIDASQRELFHTGYTSNRARQNVASFLSKHLQIDWRYGAEWYESMLVDYDVSSNWANWQYVAGVGNDPRGDARIFNPVKQAFDYDKDGAYVRTWVPEIRDLEHVENVFQPWTASREELEKHGLDNNVLATDPLKKIEFTLERKPRGNRRPFPRGRVRGLGGRGGGSGRGNIAQVSMASNPPPLIPAPLSPQMFAPMPFDAPPYPWHGVIGMQSIGWNTSPTPGPSSMAPHANPDGNTNHGPGGNNWARGRGGSRGGSEFASRGNRGASRGGFPPQ